MREETQMRRMCSWIRLGSIAIMLAALGACTGRSPESASSQSIATTPAVALQQSVMRGRLLTITRDCGACHGGMPNPAAPGWVAGKSGADDGDQMGPFRVRPANLTPDETGIGRYTTRQIFNALRYGLRPSATPDVAITSHVPGEGNHPANPRYLAPNMPWIFWRYLSDQELWDIANYLKHGLKPVRNAVPENGAPPDGWAGEYAKQDPGSHLLPPFPTEYEELRTPDRREQVLRGRTLVATAACSGCHGGALKPDRKGWLSGISSPEGEFQIGPFKTRPRNLTPDNATGLGRFSERQIFNALRFGLRPGETPDVVITSTVPGQGNHPANPKYLAPPMPWPAWRHLSDDELWAIVAYLKHGVKPVSNRVADSDGPPDFWMSEYTVEKIGPWPAVPYPTANEK
jgi:mono/diheme cytochrome c family protein